MEPSCTAMQWIASFETYSMGEPSILTRINLLDDYSINKHLGPSTTTPVAATNFSLNSSKCVVGTIEVPAAQLSSMQQNKFSSS